MWIFFIACPLPVIVRRICRFENFEKLSLLLGFSRDILEGWARVCCVHVFLVMFIPQMKKVQLSGAHNRKKKRIRDEDESRQRGALDAWIKRSKEKVGEVKDDVGAAEDSSDMESEHNTVSPQSPCQDDDSSEEDKGDFNTFLQRNFF